MTTYANPLPLVGDDIYIDTSLYLGHGVDDFKGGLCKVSAVNKGTSGGKEVDFVSVEERPDYSYNWKYLAEEQDRLKGEFDQDRGHKDPDYRPQFNDWW